MVAQQPGTPTRPGILLSGIVPPLADTYYARAETGPDLATSLHPGQTAVLVHGEETDVAPAGQGGTGKTQLAVEFIHGMWKLVDLSCWDSDSSLRRRASDRSYSSRNAIVE